MSASGALSSSMLDEAAVLMRLGFSLLLVSGKSPLRGSRGFHEATGALSDLENALARNPSATGFGIATGAPSRCVVLDVDGEAGAESLLALEAKYAPLPMTVTCRTRRGLHFYWRQSGEVRCSAGRVGPGLDVRGDGGYVVAPPSTHPGGGRYEWIRAPHEYEMADPPSWLLNLMRPPVAEAPSVEAHRPVRSTTQGPQYVREAIFNECMQLSRTPKGRRNDQLNRSAYVLARFVAEGRAQQVELREALTVAALAAGLSASEIEKTVASAFHAAGLS